MNRAFVFIVAAGLVGLGVLFGPHILFLGKGAVYNAYNIATAKAPNTRVDCSAGTPTLPDFRTEAPKDLTRITPLQDQCGWRFTVNQGQPGVKSGVRTEMRTFAAKYAQPTRYCFTLRMTDPWDKASPIVTLAQWHAVPDRVLGEKGRSPPLRLQVRDGAMEVAVMADPARVTGAPFEAGDPPTFETIARSPVSWGDGSRWCFDVVWRDKGRGRVDVHQNGETLASYSGALGFHDFSAPFFKFGVYVPGADAQPGGVWTAEFVDVELTDFEFDLAEAS